MFSKEKKPISVYWSPYFESEAPFDLSFLYPKPETLFSELTKIKSNEADNGSYFSCPAAAKKFRKTLVFKNSIDCSYIYEATDNKKSIEPLSKISIEANCMRPKSLETGPTVELSIYNLFFSDEPLEANVTPPYFHEPKHTKYGSIVPGQYDIGQWLRPLPLEIQMWKNQGELHFIENEPIFYIEFETKRPILFQRFNISQKLISYSKANTHFWYFFGRNTPLHDRYRKFNQIGYREKILTEIKKNLIDEAPYKF